MHCIAICTEVLDCRRRTQPRLGPALGVNRILCAWRIRKRPCRRREVCPHRKRGMDRQRKSDGALVEGCTQGCCCGLDRQCSSAVTLEGKLYQQTFEWPRSSMSSPVCGNSIKRHASISPSTHSSGTTRHLRQPVAFSPGLPSHSSVRRSPVPLNPVF